MSNVLNKPGARKMARTALERLEELENSMQQVIQGFNSALVNMNRTIEENNLVLSSLVELVGESQVTEKIKELVERKKNERITKEKADLEHLLSEKKLTKTDTVKDNSVIVLKETSLDDKTTIQDWVRIPMDTVMPEFKVQLVGKQVGFKLSPTPSKTTIELLEIYDPSIVEFSQEITETK